MSVIKNVTVINFCMLDISDLKKGTIFLWRDDPYEVLKASHSKMANEEAVLQVKIKNIRTKNLITTSFKHSDKFEEADISREKVKFVYSHKGEHIFSAIDNPGARFPLKDEEIGDKSKFLKPNSEVEVVKFEDKVINIILPIKLDLKVKEAPPGIRGDTAQGGKKTVILETGAEVQAPLFIEEGDVIRVNTETGEYVERISKA